MHNQRDILRVSIPSIEALASDLFINLTGEELKIKGFIIVPGFPPKIPPTVGALGTGMTPTLIITIRLIDLAYLNMQ